MCKTMDNPTKDELLKIDELREAIKECLVNNISISDVVRQTVSKDATDKDILLRYIRGRKLNVEKARDSLIRYAQVRCELYPEVFPDQVPEFVHRVFNVGILNVLRHRDDLGRTIITFNPNNWDETEISLEEIIVAGRYLVDALINLPDFLTKGGILLCNCVGSSLGHAKQYTIPTITKFVNVFWQAYPIQIKGLYYVNAPFFVRPIYAIIKPFLPSKLKERVLLTSGVCELHKRLSPEILPESLGGMLKNEEATSLDFLHLPPPNNV